jgi:ribosomal protein L18
LALFCTAGNLKAQIIAPNNQELIVYVKQTDDKNRETIKQDLLNAGGVSLVGYCGSQQMFYVLVDRNRHADDLFLEAIFRNLNMTYEIKTGASIAQALAGCANGYIAFPADNHSAR